MGKVIENHESKQTRKKHILSRVSHVEEQAIRNLNEKFTANKSRLMKEFTSLDPDNTGDN